MVTEDVVVGMLSYTDLLRLSFADVTDNVDEDADALVYNMFTIKQVMKKPVITPKTRLEVITLKIDLNLSPANFWIPSLITFIP